MTEPEMDDPFEDPDFKDWAKGVLEDMVPKLRDSSFTVSLFPRSGVTDVKYAVELGYSIMLNKPILLIVPPDIIVPHKLRIVADRVVVVDWDTDVGEQIRQHVEDFLSYVAALDRVRDERDVD